MGEHHRQRSLSLSSDRWRCCAAWAERASMPAEPDLERQAASGQEQQRGQHVQEGQQQQQLEYDVNSGDDSSRQDKSPSRLGRFGLSRGGPDSAAWPDRLWALTTRGSLARQHLWIQFPCAFIFLALLVAGVCASDSTRRVRWTEIFLGASACLAADGLKRLVLTLLEACPTCLTPRHRRTSGLEDPFAALGASLATLVHVCLQELFRWGAIVITVALLPELDSPFNDGDDDDVLPGHIALRDDDSSTSSSSSSSASETDSDAPSSDDEDEDDVARVAHPDEPDAHEQLRHDGVDAAAHAGFDFDTGELEPAPVAEADAVLRALERREIVAAFGAPLFQIPVAVVLVWRLDSILLALDLSLFLALPYRSTLPPLFPLDAAPTFVIVVLIHAVVSLEWLVRVRLVGLPAVSYATLIILLGFFFFVLT